MFRPKAFSNILELDKNTPSTSNSTHISRIRAPAILKPKNRLAKEKQKSKPKIKKETGKKNANILADKENQVIIDMDKVFIFILYKIIIINY